MSQDENSRRLRDECDQDEDIKATVRKAQSFVDGGLMTEEEALKYFNLPRSVYEKFRTPAAS